MTLELFNFEGEIRRALKAKFSKMSTDSPPKTVAYFLDPDVGNFHYGSLNV